MKKRSQNLKLKPFGHFVGDPCTKIGGMRPGRHFFMSTFNFLNGVSDKKKVQDSNTNESSLIHFKNQ